MSGRGREPRVLRAPGGYTKGDVVGGRQFIDDFTGLAGDAALAAVTIELLDVREALLDLYDIVNPGCK